VRSYETYERSAKKLEDIVDKIKEEIITNLKEVYDPEISINVYDLGLIYNIDIKESHVNITMTLTSAFCPAADMIVSDVHEAVCKVESIETCDVDVTFDPPFGPDKMSDEAKLILGW
jgi:metal-sulfur cluster biosynthetic enzyme